MKIKSTIIGVFAILFSVAFCSSAQAELLSVSGGIPVSHSISGYSTYATGGVMVHVKLPIMVGFGIEKYKTTFTSAELLSLDTTMYDVFYLLPIPIINVTLGLGVGTADQLGTSSVTHSAATMTQFYAQLGFPFFPFMDAHLSYHNTQGKLSGNPGYSDINVGGEVIGLGVSFSF